MPIVFMACLFNLRRNERLLDRSYRVPFRPMLPAIALFCGVVCLFALVHFDPMLTVLSLMAMALACLCFHFTSAQRAAAPVDATQDTAE